MIFYQLDKIKPEACTKPDHDEMPKTLICLQKECQTHQKVGYQYCLESNENQKEDHSSHAFVTLKQFQQKLEKCNAIDILQVIKEIEEQVSEEQMFEKIDEIVNTMQEKFIITCKGFRKQMKLFVEEVFRDCQINQYQQTLIRNQSEKQKKQPKNFAEMMKNTEQIKKYIGVYQKLAEGKDIKEIKTEQDNEELEQIDLEKQINDKISSIQKVLQEVDTQKIEPVIEQMKNAVDQFLNTQQNQIINVPIKTIEQIQQEQEQNIQQQEEEQRRQQEEEEQQRQRQLQEQELQQNKVQQDPPQAIEVIRLLEKEVNLQDWKKICDDVKNAKNLQTLYLYFTNNLNLTDESLKELISSLKQQQDNLQNFIICFYSNGNFKHESLKELCAVLQKMKNLKAFGGTFLGIEYLDLQDFIKKFGN